LSGPKPLDAQPTSWFSRHRRRITTVGAGHLLYATFNWFFDNVLYVFIVYRYGLLWGGAIMTALSLVQCAVTLLAYERMRIDWVGAGSLARVTFGPNPSWWQSLILWAARRGNAAVFITLSVFQDPFITTAYFLQGRFDGLSGRAWRIFFGSVFVSNFYWTLRSGVVATLLFSAWRWVIQP
jgi:hypothetical protein